jgi:Phr family secreted Rap phosphatase inhibitor
MKKIILALILLLALLSGINPNITAQDRDKNHDDDDDHSGCFFLFDD